jgi:hypothetical protein
LKPDNSRITELIIDCVYNPQLSCNLFAAEQAKRTHGIWHCIDNNTIRRTDTKKIVGYMEIAGGALAKGITNQNLIAIT